MAYDNQTVLMKRIVSAVEQLVATKAKHKKFRFKYELLEELNIKLSDWGKYSSRKSPQRIPDTNGNLTHITQHLTEKYEVNPAYFKSGELPILLWEKNDTSIVNEESSAYNSITKQMWNAKLNEITDKSKLILQLEKRLIGQEKYIALLEEKIETLTSKKPVVTATAVH